MQCPLRSKEESRPATLRDNLPYIDPGIDYDKVLVDRNAARWLRKLKDHGYLQRIRSRVQWAA